MTRIGFIGDIFLNPRHNCGTFSVSPKLLEEWNMCDRVCINMEGPVISGGNLPSADKKGPCIFQDKDRIKFLLDIPNTIYDLANNHIMDYGIRGLNDTISFIGKERCFGAGTDSYREYVVADKGPESVAIVAVGENGFGCDCDGNSAGYAWFDSSVYWERLRELKDRHTALIVVSHAGLEDENIPLPELRQLYKRFVDCGADAVIAHHPHVIQGKETYKGKDIYYSLGNAAFEQLDTGEPYNCDSISVIVDIEDGVVSTRVIPLKYENGILSTNQDAIELFNKATNLIKDEKEYLRVANEMCLRHYKNEYSQYYKAVFGRKGRIKNFILAILYLFGKEVFDEDMLYHNIMIETHYWCVKRALGYIKEKEERK